MICLGVLTIISCIYFIRFNNISDSSRLDSPLSFVWLQKTSDHETLIVFHDDFLCMLLDDIAITHPWGGGLSMCS